jgi:hypothetical protein
MSDDKRIGRTVRLTQDINQRLIDLCDHLGTNPNAYLVNEIGKSIARDEVTFLVKRSQGEMFDNLAKALESVVLEGREGEKG